MTDDRRLSEELRALTEAGISLTSELTLEAVLQKLVDVARELVNARYAAMSVLGPDGEMRRFFFSGISQADSERIGAWPTGRGLLGVLLRENTSLRMADIGEDPRSLGFPPNHPAMRSLLGVPVVALGRVIGNLYLTEKPGGELFSERDEEIVRLLSTQAAVAVHNAELYEAESRRAEEWKALFELGRQVAASPDLQALLDSIVSRARKLLSTDVAALMLLTGDGANLYMAAHEGLQTAGMQRLRLLAEHGLQGLALETMRPAIVEDYQTDPRLRDRPAALVAQERLVSQICVPLIGKAGPVGTLTVGNRHATKFSARNAELLEAFASWGAVAIETSRLYDKLESLARLEERERIGMDLHDGVIQSIYAVGLKLEDCSERLQEPAADVKAALEKAIEDLNKVIKDIRSYIFDLRPQVSQVRDLPDALSQLTGDLRVNSLIAADLQVEGSLDGLLDEAQALGIFHIAQEALNNVSKHSKASSVRVRLACEEKHVSLEVSDNGAGFDSTGAIDVEKQGLRNMRDRARSLGAELIVESSPGQGTTVTLELPLTSGKG